MFGGEISYQHVISDSVTGFLVCVARLQSWRFQPGPCAGRSTRIRRRGAVEYRRRRKVRVARWRPGGQRVDLLQPARRSTGAIVAAAESQRSGLFRFFTDNAAKGETWGFEADLNWAPTDSVSLFATMGLLDAEFDSFVTPDRDLSGRDQAHAPGYSLAAGGTYRHAGGLFARIDVAARDDFFFRRKSRRAVACVRVGECATRI